MFVTIFYSLEVCDVCNDSTVMFSSSSVNILISKDLKIEHLMVLLRMKSRNLLGAILSVKLNHKFMSCVPAGEEVLQPSVCRY